MRRSLPFILYLAAVSALSGWLMSHMSFIGRVGINLMHQEYKILKVWYGGGAVVFCVLLLLFIVQYAMQRRLSPTKTRTTQIIALIAALAGLWATYSDFRSDFTHSILRERFHLGAYLFWIGWASISLYLLAVRGSQKRPSKI